MTENSVRMNRAETLFCCTQHPSEHENTKQILWRRSIEIVKKYMEIKRTYNEWIIFTLQIESRETNFFDPVFT